MFRECYNFIPSPGFLKRYASNGTTHFRLFPKSFPHGGPPKDLFQVSLRLLRREYRGLQSENHPDVVMGASALSGNSENGLNPGNESASSQINDAYTTLRNPYTRAAYIIKLYHPNHIDITQDDVSKRFISQVQAGSTGSKEHLLNYKALLMIVLEAHEALESALTEADLAPLEHENSCRIKESEEVLDALVSQEPIPWDEFIIETIKVKYWVNIDNGLKDWEPGKPMLLTH